MEPEDLRSTDLVALAMRKLDAANAPQLADKLGMTKRNQDKTVRRWIDGESEPSYPHTLRLLQAVDLFRDDAAEYLRAALAEAMRAERAAQRLDDEVPSQARRGNA